MFKSLIGEAAGSWGRRAVTGHHGSKRRIYAVVVKEDFQGHRGIK